MARQFGGRFPSEIAHISSREFQRIVETLKHEQAQAAAKARETQRDSWLRSIRG